MQFTEDTLVQQTTAEYLLENLCWDDSIYGMDEKFGINGTLGRNNDTEVILTRYLLPKLKEFNPALPEEAYNDAIRKISEISSSQSILNINREKDNLYKSGIDVIFRNSKGERAKKRLRIFDFENPEKNHFLVVREFWIKGDIYRRRADIMGFINGIPLLFMEVKNIHKNIRTAYEKNLSDYKDTVPHLFFHNAIIILGNGINAKIGSISSKFEHFSEWKRLSESEPGVVDIETLLKGVCSKKNFMDIFENFILFDESHGKPIKIVARNHQFLGVNKAVEAVKTQNIRDGRLGVFWHTQGSGKSYSIVFFTKKVHRKLGGNYTFLVLTDREDLDTQIYKTFSGCGLADNDKAPCRASSGIHLKELISQHKSYIFSLIQKFNIDVKKNEHYSERSDIIVITDEAHRTQYGKLALNLRNALPNAGFIGFTGTPLFSDDEITKRVFGEYISTYDFQRAVDDNATVPLYYDARGEKLGISTNDINEKIADKIEEIGTDDIDLTQRLEKELRRDYHIITAGKRLNQIAKDFVDHYSEAWGSGKAMFVCIDKITCVRIHKLIDFYWKEKIKELEKSLLSCDEQEIGNLQNQIFWMKEMFLAVVISEEQGEVEKFKKWDLDIKPHRKFIKDGFTDADNRRIDLEEAFKNEKHPFRIAIVCAMWLTGFDVPSLSTLYLDKPLKAHTLMQAIARANRVNEGKNNGLIVDYCGILKNLRKALATFAGKGDEGHGDDNDKDPTRPESELLEELEESINAVKAFLHMEDIIFNEIIEAKGFEKNARIVQAKEIINENDRTRKRFEIMARNVFKKFKACIHLKNKINDFRTEKEAISIIYKSLQDDREKTDISQIIREIHKVVDQTIIPEKESGQKVEDEHALYDISKINFDLLRKEFERSKKKNTIVQSLKTLVEKKLELLLRKNPLRTDFQKHYENIIEEYNNEKDKVTIEKTFQALLIKISELDEEEHRHIKEKLDEETLSVYDLLRKPELNKKEIKRIKEVAANLLKKLKEEKLKIENWKAKEATRDAVKQTIHDFLFDESTGLPLSYSEEEISFTAEQVFAYIFRTYPFLPSPFYAEVS